MNVEQLCWNDHIICIERNFHRQLPKKRKPANWSTGATSMQTCSSNWLQPPYVLMSSPKKQRLRSSPAHSWTPTMPKMKKTKKQRRRTLPSIGRVSNRRVTRIRIPRWTKENSISKKKQKTKEYTCINECRCFKLITVTVELDLGLKQNFATSIDLVDLVATALFPRPL